MSSKSKSQSQSQNQSQSQRPGWFVRPHATDASQPMSSNFDLHGVQAFFFLYADGSVEVFKRLKDGSCGSKPIATGSIRQNRAHARNPNAPHAIGTIRTGKGSKFGLALWWYADTESPEPRPYWVLRYELERPAPKGQVVSPAMLPA